MKMNGPESLEDMMQQVLAARDANPARDMPVNPRIGAGDPIAGAFAAPVSAERYQIAVPPDMMRDAELEAKARQWFHRAGLPQGAVSGIIQEYCRQLCAGDRPMDASGAQRTQAELTQEWGPEYQRKIEAAQALVAKSGGAAELAEILASSGLGDNPWLIRTLAALAELGPTAGGGK